MEWLLFLISINLTSEAINETQLAVSITREVAIVADPNTGKPYRFKTMNDCFVQRELAVENIGRPVINYQSICVATTRYQEAEELAQVFKEMTEEMKATGQNENPLGLVEPDAAYERF